MDRKRDKEPQKRLREYLPPIYQEPEEGDFFDKFLLAFEKVLLGRLDGPAPGAEKKEAAIEGLKDEIDQLHLLFDAKKTPEEFLPWLASWAALNLRADLSTERQRTLIENIIPLYRIRGTRAYLEQLLNLYLGVTAQVLDAEAPALQVGLHSSVGRDTHIGGGPPFFFRVFVELSETIAIGAEKTAELAHPVIQLAKPAHTYYELEFVSHFVQQEVYSSADPELAAENGPSSEL